MLTDTFSGWVKAYPTKEETAQVVVKKLLDDIIPRYRMLVETALLFPGYPV